MRAFSTILLICIALSGLACDPEEAADEYFRQMGLTRLAVPRTDVVPGTIFLVKGDEAFLEDHMLDSVEEGADPSHLYGIFGGSATEEVDAVLRKFSGRTQLSGNMAMSFLVSVFQLNPRLNLGLTDNVTIQISDPKVRKMKVASIEKFMSRSESAIFQRTVLRWLEGGLTPYVVYEVYRAKSLKVVAEQGKDVAPSLEASTTTPLPIKGEGAVAYKKTASNELVLMGDRYYAFAVKTARFKKSGSDSDPNVVIDRTEFVKAEEWGIKSAGTDDQYAAPLLKRFAPVILKVRLPADL